MLNGKGSDSWGFIRACDRPGDVFFHASQLKGMAMSELRLGDDLEFSVGRDSTPDQPKRIVAVRCLNNLFCRNVLQLSADQMRSSAETRSSP